MFCRCGACVSSRSSKGYKEHCYFIWFYSCLTRFVCLTLQSQIYIHEILSPSFMTFEGRKNCEFAIFFMATHLTGSRYIMKLCWLVGRRKNFSFYSKDCLFIRSFYFDNHPWGVGNRDRRGVHGTTVHKKNID